MVRFRVENEFDFFVCVDFRVLCTSSIRIEQERSDVRVDIDDGPAHLKPVWPTGLARVRKIVSILGTMWLQVQRFKRLGRSRLLASDIYELVGGANPAAADLIWVPLGATLRCEFMVHSCQRADEGSRCRPIAGDRSKHCGTRHDITHRNVFVLSSFALLR